MREEIEERLFGWTDNAELNKYLVYAILEHIILKVVPELKDKTASELLAERGVDMLEYAQGDGEVVRNGGREKVNGA